MDSQVEHSIGNQSGDLPLSELSLFARLPHGPPDRSLEFAQDTNPNKIDLRVGVYRDRGGVTKRLSVVRKVEAQVLADLSTSELQPSFGHKAFIAASEELIFGKLAKSDLVGRIASVQTVGSTSALRNGADLLARILGNPTVYISNLFWGDHLRIFERGGFTVLTHRYFDESNSCFDFSGMRSDFSKVPPGSVVVLQPQNHNPTGVCPTADQWRELIDLISKRNLIPFVDSSYQGFGLGIDEDVWLIRELSKSNQPFLVAHSFCKSFTFYDQRLGILCVVARESCERIKVLKALDELIRTDFGSAPYFGAQVIATILDSPDLKSEWIDSLNEQREDLNQRRQLLVSALDDQDSSGRFSFIRNQTGPFAYLNLGKEIVKKLRHDYGVYLVGKGRLCLSGLTEQNCSYVAKSIVNSAR